MTGVFSGMVSTEDSTIDDTLPKIPRHISIDQTIDLRIDMIKEYLKASPDATLKDIKSKALAHFSKATDDELKELIKLSNIDKYNELYPQINTPSISLPNNKSKYTKEEIEFLEKYRDSDYKRAEVYDKYKKAFPTSTRKIQFLSDYYFSHTTKQPVIKHVQNPVQSVTNHHILAKAITALYKSGKSPKMFLEIKPIIELINDPNEIDFAIECLTS